MTMADNIKFSRHKEIRGVGYRKYDNYDAIEVPYTDAIPSDYDKVIRIPKAGSEKLDPNVFEILPILFGNPDDEHYVYVRILVGGEVSAIQQLTTKYNYYREDLRCFPGVMGVPISFLDKFCPEQFEIVGQSLTLANMEIIRRKLGHLNGGPRLYVTIDGELKRLYDRILIRKKPSSATS